MGGQAILLDPSIDGVLGHSKVRRNPFNADPRLVAHRAPKNRTVTRPRESNRVYINRSEPVKTAKSIQAMRRFAGGSGLSICWRPRSPGRSCSQYAGSLGRSGGDRQWHPPHRSRRWWKEHPGPPER